jgi:hypothetical protein
MSVIHRVHVVFVGNPDRGTPGSGSPMERGGSSACAGPHSAGAITKMSDHGADHGVEFFVFYLHGTCIRVTVLA